MLAEDLSTHQLNAGNKAKPEKDGKALQALGTNAINELELKVDLSQPEDVQELSTILVELLSYPNSDLAQIHADAMRLGNYDLESTGKLRSDTSSSLLDENGSSKMCPCCGFVKQADTISLCTSFEDIKNMGISTYLYFSNYKKLSILLVILTIIYSFFALITNVIASKNGSNPKTSIDYIAISLSSKETNDNSDNRKAYFAQCCLGVITIIVWIFALAIMKFKELKNIEEYDNDTISCSDYSVVMEGMPLDVSKDELQKQFDTFYANLKEVNKVPTKWDKPIKIAKLNVGKPFYLNEESFKDEEIDRITKNLEETKDKIIQLIVERRDRPTFSMPKGERTQLYQSYRDLNERKTKKLLEIATNIKQSLKEQSDDENTTVFVTFESNFNRILMANLHESSIVGRIKSICGKTIENFWYEREGKFFQLEIRRAPEPEDIIWTNLGQKNCSTYLRKLFTYSVTILLLGICFGIVYGLSKAQEDASNSRPISIAISLTISIVNIMLGQVIRYLTVFEKDYTETYRQASLMIKSVLAQMINTILIPIITAYYVKNKNFYYENGLVDNIFMLSVSTIIVPPLVLLVNPSRIVTSIIRCVKSTPKNKLSQNQREHNILQEGVEFEVGYQSIYPVSVFMFVCFFVSLQPIISVIALLGYFLMYWVEKYSIFNRYRRPVPGMDFVNNTAYKLISFGPIVYSFGSLTWANFSPNGIPPEAIVPNLVALGLSFLLFILPFNSIIIGACMSDSAEKPTIFEEDRIFMPSEYDRLNPDTQTKGFEDYKAYMDKKRDQFKNMNQEQQAEIAKKMMTNAQRGQMMNQARPHIVQDFSFMQGGYNYMQPQQPMIGYDFARNLAPPSMQMPYMNYAPYSPMGSYFGNSLAYPQMAPMAPQPQVHQGPPSFSQQQQQQQQPSRPVNQGPPQHYQPQTNPLNAFMGNPNLSTSNQNMSNPVQFGGVNPPMPYNPNQYGNSYQGYPNNPNPNPQGYPGTTNQNNAYYGGTQPQGRHW